MNIQNITERQYISVWGNLIARIVIDWGAE